MQVFSKKIFSNSLWMMLEKVISIFGLIFVNALMAKYIGPENFGKLAFTTSIFLFVQTLAWFGAQNILFKRFSQNAQSGLKLAISTQKMRQFLCVLVSAIALVYLWLYTDPLTFIFGLGNFIASYFIVSDFYTTYNNSQLISYVNAISNTIGLAVALILRFLLVYFEAEPYTMVYPIIIIALIPYLLRKIYYHQKNKKIYITHTKKYNKYLFLTGSSLVFSTLSIVFYTQISNIFLAKFVSFSELAIYNVALTLGGAWGFVNLALITSFFSKIYEEKQFEAQQKILKQLHIIVLVISGCALLGMLWLGEWVVAWLYGVEYIASANLLPYIVIGTSLSALGTISYRYMIKFNAYRYLAIKMFIMAIFSSGLSYFLINQYGVVGASICFVIVEFISLTIANYFFKKSIILKMHLKCLGLKV
ncbi:MULTISPECIES: oligosaccharide flippase family protein [unclassified Acinetobacter]|uniref:oligosaccharide flippase family protein n=1 Tax=unclassified Acinetobacter TaxID=196816 RepID=UPI0015D21BFC|nr:MULTISPECIES: oligosaccharide flippase family protein [unclassified Acinetobacter]